MNAVLGRLEGALYRGLRCAVMASFVTLLVLLTAVVFVRFVPVISMGWSDELVELAFAWMVFFGAAVLWRDRGHFRVEMIPLKLAGSSAGRALDVALALLSLAFFVVFTYEAALLTRAATDRTPIFVLSKTLWYGAMPVAGTVIVGYTVRDLLLLLAGRRRACKGEGR